MLILGAIAGASIVGILSFTSFMQLVALITTMLAIIFASGAMLNALRRRRDRRANRLYLNHRYGKGRGGDK